MRRLLTALSTLALTATFLIAAVMIVPGLFGIERYVILTGSMTGTYDPGSLIFDERVPVTDVRVGDVVTFVPPASSGIRGPITHRVTVVGRNPAGERYLQTKGDANQVADDWRFAPRDGQISRVVAGVPHLGHVFSALNTRTGRTVVFAVPGILIFLSVLAGVWREAGEAQRRHEQRGLTAVDGAA